MAEAIPFTITEIILMKLGSSVFQQIGLIYGVNDELRRLCETLSTVKAVLLDADEQQERSHLAQDWVRKLKFVVYDADDVFATKACRREFDFQERMKFRVRDFFSSSNRLTFRYKMSRNIKEIRERLDGVAEDMSNFNFRERFVDAWVGHRKREETHSFVLASAVVGREKDKEEIVRLLMCSNVRENVSIISIVGIGGLGKTALAKLVYNDERVVENFELRMWVGVYEQFDVKLLIQKILKSTSGNLFGDFEMLQVQNLLRDMEMENLQIYLREKLSGKRYLLILDDVWNENHEKWVQLRDLLLGGARGSKILVTTRSQMVAHVMDIESPYILESLAEDECWYLFKQLAFKEGQDEEHPNLAAIGKNIMKKCHGVPLAIRTLGRMMKSKTKESEWLSIQNHEIWELPREENDILTILKLSYDHLPVYLKQCFAYCSLFPKGCEFERKKLIQLWMAQSYILPSGGDHLLEDIANQYFQELLMRSFFQELQKDDYGNIISCKMHDLMHDLACSVAQTECCIAHVEGGNIFETVHHVSFDSYLPSSWNAPPPLLKAKKMRTFILPVQYQTGYKFTHGAINSCFKCLRVLDLHNLRIEKVPNSIGELNHLRYLDLSKNFFLTTLPGPISKLQNLQTLKLERCYKLKELPRDIRKMISLRHLEINGCGELTHMPSGLGQLTLLQSLPMFVLGKNPSNSRYVGRLCELKSLNHLRGELNIVNLECTNSVSLKSKEANLKGKQHLQALRLNWYREDSNGKDADVMLLEGLQPHQNLKELHIHGYGGVRFPRWMMSNMVSLLPNLVVITIESCGSCQFLPEIDQLPSLKVLKLYGLDSIEYITNTTMAAARTASSSGTTPTPTYFVNGVREEVFFPSLEELVLYDLPLLNEVWPRNVEPISSIFRTEVAEARRQHQQPSLQFFPCLTKLTIVDCPLLMPCVPYLEELVKLRSLRSY